MRRLFLSAVFLASGASATEYVVSPDGLDSAPGTQAQPLRTVEAAARVMRPGDACTLRGGRYEQQAHIEGLKGEEGRPCGP